MQIRKSVCPKTSARHRLRELEALKMRGENMPFLAIAERLGVSINTARSYCVKAMASLRSESADLARDMRETILADNDSLLVKLADMLLDDTLSIDDQMKIVDRINKIHDQQAKLVGSYAAVKTEADVVVSPGQAFVPKDELLQRLRERGVAIDVASQN